MKPIRDHLVDFLVALKNDGHDIKQILVAHGNDEGGAVEILSHDKADIPRFLKSIRDNLDAYLTGNIDVVEDPPAN